MPAERQFDFSEMYIFGKFDTFTRRLKKIIEMFDTIEMYSHLPESKIEGMEVMANKFTVVVTAMRKKPYDFLDHRRMEFDQDYDDFRRQISELHNTIKTFMNQRFDKIIDTQRALHLLHKFERMNLPNLGIDDKYQRILSHYARDIDMIARIYQKNKTDPPIDRDLPPIAGKICWARQLYRRIQEPMDIFQLYPQVLQTTEAKKSIKNFNKLAKVLLEYEVLYHRGWLRQVEAVKSGLQASLLVRHPETGELYVNFDPQIMTMIRETECITRLGLDIPDFAQTLRARQHEYKDIYNNLQVMLKEHTRVRDKIPPAFDPLMAPYIAQVDDRIDPGLTMLTWTSIKINEYIDDVHDELSQLELLMDRVQDICDYRIDQVLQEMSSLTLCELPEDEPWSVDHFLENTQLLCAKGAVTLQTKSINVEEAANELINLMCEECDVDDLFDLTGHITDGEDVDSEGEGGKKSHPSSAARSKSGSKRGPSRPWTAAAVAKQRKEMHERIEEAAFELLKHFNQRNMDALQKVCRNTLEALRKRITSSSMVHYIGE